MVHFWRDLLLLLLVTIIAMDTTTAQTNFTTTTTTSWSKTLNGNNNNNNNNNMASTRIVGGVLATSNEFPYYVAPTGADFLCGGSLVHEQIVATAAHCASAFPVGGSVYVGAYVLDSARGGAQKRTVKRLFPHPDYSDSTIWNDFMLIQLNEPVEDARIVKLEFDPSQPVNDDTLTVMGFGALDEEGAMSFTLQKVDIYPVNFETCESRYAVVAQYPLQPKVQMCAAYPGGGRDACQGDSGGPLINSQGKQVGIVSVGYGCARPEIPGIYARISGAKDFFQRGICTLASESNLPDYCDGLPTQKPPSTGPTAAGELKITIGYDFYVDETTWQISQGSTVLYEGPQYNPQPYQAYSTIFSVVPPGTYTFTIFDSECDGLNSLFGDGFFEIWWVPNDPFQPAQLLADGDHDFECSSAVSFTVPDSRRLRRHLDGTTVNTGFSNVETVSSKQVQEHLIASPKLATIANDMDIMDLEDAYKHAAKTIPSRHVRSGYHGC